MTVLVETFCFSYIYIHKSISEILLLTVSHDKNLKASGLEKFQMWSTDSESYFSFKDLCGWAKFIFKGVKEEIQKHCSWENKCKQHLWKHCVDIAQNEYFYLLLIYPEVTTQNMQSYALRFHHSIYRSGKLETPKSSTLEEWINYYTPCTQLL